MKKHFVDEQDGLKNIMDAVSKFEFPVTRELSDIKCAWNPMAPTEQLFKWKHTYRALEKLAEARHRRLYVLLLKKTSSKP